ncbi:MAG: cytochrome c3 family protein [Planctomycetes bacterium]|nr:cytochrome c3 family protein [Planctomycetota bacterium]
MRVLWAITLACVTGTAASADVGPVARPRINSDLNSCVLCHCTPEFWGVDQQPLYLPKEHLSEDAHFRAGVKCYDCHGGDRTSFDKSNAHSMQLKETGMGIGPFRSGLSEVRKSCWRCHQEEASGLAGGVHAEEGAPKADGSPTPLACNTCHGLVKHRLVPHDDPQSPVFLKNQVNLCGNCHPDELDTYLQSVHGHGLTQSGLLVTASCSDCHGAHGIYRADEEASTLHSAKVASTCGQCHRFVEQRLKKSVHGNGNGPGTATEKAAAGGHGKRRPTCTDCHFGSEGHDLPDPRSQSFRLRLGDRCGGCHDDVSRGFAQSLHGALDDLGYGPAAKCSDCHGAHDIPPIDDASSPVLRGQNRLETCQKCHPYAVANFCDFRPHADHGNAEDHPLLYWVYLAMEALIYSVFAFFGLHTILWFIRSTIHVKRHGRPKRLMEGDPACVRFEPIHRATHAVVVVSFLGLALTGLPLKYSSQDWAQGLARVLGGFESTSTWHRIFALLTVGYFATHLLWLAGQVWRCLEKKTPLLTIFLGPDSPIPGPRDLLDMIRMFRWFVGWGPKPVFERWTYWEKFDYWAVFWGVGIIGTSGMMLWFPNLFSMVLPGVALNLAKIIHSEEALLATSFIFAVHFFGTHLRPEKFPMDMAILSGLIDEEEMREERPEFYERMRREGKLDELRTTVPSRRTLRVITTAGFVAVTVGLGLLVGILLAIFGGTH